MTEIDQSRWVGTTHLFSADEPMQRSAGFQTCCVADFQVGTATLRPAGLETRDTADLEVCATQSRCRTAQRAVMAARGTVLWMVLAIEAAWAGPVEMIPQTITLPAHAAETLF